MDKRLNALEHRVTALEDKVERRLFETRPIRESVLEQLKGVNERLTRMENDVKDFRYMFRRSYSDLARVQADFDERLEKLEGRDAPK